MSEDHFAWSLCWEISVQQSVGDKRYLLEMHKLCKFRVGHLEISVYGC